MEKRAQAAMEFLFTYGWTVLVLGVVIFTLTYFSGFEVKFVAERCGVYGELTCLDVKVETSSISLLIQNNVGERVTIDSIVVKKKGGSNCTLSPSIELKSGDKAAFTIGGCSNGNKNDKFEGEISITYTKQDLLTHTIEGQLSSEITTESASQQQSQQGQNEANQTQQQQNQTNITQPPSNETNFTQPQQNQTNQTAAANQTTTNATPQGLGYVTFVSEQLKLVGGSYLDAVRFDATMYKYPGNHTAGPPPQFRDFYEVLMKFYESNTAGSFNPIGPYYVVLGRFYSNESYPKTKTFYYDFKPNTYYLTDFYFEEYPWGTYAYNKYYINRIEFVTQKAPATAPANQTTATNQTNTTNQTLPGNFTFP